MSEYLSRNFKRSELQCPCCKKCEINPVLLTRIQTLRDLFGPIIITSGYRCMKHNQKVGGAEKSYHLNGNAVDIRIKTFDSKRRYKLIKTIYELGFTGIGIGKSKLHVDIRDGPPSSWSYP